MAENIRDFLENLFEIIFGILFLMSTSLVI